MKKRVLLTGCNGQLGKSIQEISQDYPDVELICTDKAELDITQIEAIRSFIKGYQVEGIINVSGYTAVAKAEEETVLAYLVNKTAVENLATIAKENGIYLIHISTDYVFDGESHLPYKPEDSVNPISVYGKSKLMGEEGIKRIGCRSIIIRISWLYSSYGNNFVKTMIRLSALGNPIKVVSDQWGSPTNAKDLSEVILKIVRQGVAEGVSIYHYSNEGETNWYKFTEEIMRLMESNCPIVPISTTEYSGNVKRPNYSVLDHEKIIKAFDINIPRWEESLSRDFMKIKYQTDNQCNR